MPSLAQVRNAVDASLLDFYTNRLGPRQDAYFAAKGRYWQGILTTDLGQVPENPNDASAVREMAPTKTRRPTDQPETWNDAGVEPGNSIPMSMEVHAYDGPLGHGYTVIVWFKWDGGLYTRTRHNGPEDWRRQEWTKVQEMVA